MKTLRIKSQLKLAILIPVLSVSLLFAIFYNINLYQTVHHEIIKLGSSYINQFLPAAQFAMMRRDYRTLQGLINASTNNIDLKAVAFYNTKGQLLAYRGGHPSINKFFKLPAHGVIRNAIESKKLNSYTYNFLAPINIPKFNLYTTDFTPQSINFTNTQADNILGWLSVNLDTKNMLIKTYEMYALTILIMLAGLLIGLLSQFLFIKKVANPVTKLRHTMQKILANNFDAAIDLSNLPKEFLPIAKGCVYLQRRYLNAIQDLNQQVEIATKDLQQSFEFLEEKNIKLVWEKKKIEEESKQKLEFLASISHEVRAPLNGIIGFTNVLLESKLNNMQHDYTKTIKSSAQDLLTIINDILDYSKIEVGKLQLDYMPLDLRACIDEILMMHLSHATKKGLDLISIIASNIPQNLIGDPTRLKQIITNLVNNAIKFTDYGHVLIQTKIVKETEQDFIICIQIIDTGIGISDSYQGKLFYPFSQAKQHPTGGSGLGLVICKALAIAMEGDISFFSDLNKGSTFSVSVKLKKLPAYENESNQFKLYKNYKILCFDNNPYYLESLCNLLAHFGAICIKVNNINELKKAIKKNNDYYLSFINVEEKYLHKLDKILVHHNRPYILMGKIPPDEPCLLKAKAYLQKPITIRSLQNILDSFLEEPVLNEKIEQTNLNNLYIQLKELHPKILIADDNNVNCMLMKSLLNDNTSLEIVNNGEEVVKVCQNHAFDILILDLHMPKINGAEAVALIRKGAAFNKFTPIIIISADSNNWHKYKFLQSEIALFLTKPLKEEELIDAIVTIFLKNKDSSKTEESIIPLAIDWELCIEKSNGNSTLATEYLKEFIKELIKNRTEFIDLWQAKNFDALASAAHKLRGACCFCGVPNLQSQIMLLETELQKNKKHLALEKVFKNFLKSIDEVINDYQILHNSVVASS